MVSRGRRTRVGDVVVDRAGCENEDVGQPMRRRGSKMPMCIWDRNTETYEVGCQQVTRTGTVEEIWKVGQKRR